MSIHLPFVTCMILLTAINESRWPRDSDLQRKIRGLWPEMEGGGGNIEGDEEAMSGVHGDRRQALVFIGRTPIDNFNTFIWAG